MPVTIYGIKNCGTMKKTFAWFDAHGVGYSFHDYKKAGISRDKLEGWADRAGWEQVINRSGLTFRGLPEGVKQTMDKDKAIALMLEKPSMIKRPIIEDETGKLIIGLSVDGLATHFTK